MVGLVEERFPSAIRSDRARDARRPAPRSAPIADHHLAEERRLFYVGMTRAPRGARPELGRTITAARRLAPYQPVRHRGARPAARNAARGACGRASLERLARHEEPARAPATRRCAGARRTAARPLSFGQINDYLDCPARYRYASRRSASPRPPSHQLVYGRALHAAVQAFPSSADASRPMAPRRAHAELDAELGVGRIPDPRPRGGPPRLRRGMRLTGSGTSSSRIPPARQRGAGIRVHARCATGVRGRYDRVDVEADGRVTITDYKSSDVRDPATAHRRAKESLQLSIYALAYEAQHGSAAGRAGAPLPRVRASLAAREPTERRLAKAHGTGRRRGGEGIRAGRFDATPRRDRAAATARSARSAPTPRGDVTGHRLAVVALVPARHPRRRGAGLRGATPVRRERRGSPAPGSAVNRVVVVALAALSVALVVDAVCLPRRGRGSSPDRLPRGLVAGRATRDTRAASRSGPRSPALRLGGALTDAGRDLRRGCWPPVVEWFAIRLTSTCRG